MIAKFALVAMIWLAVHGQEMYNNNEYEGGQQQMMDYGGAQGSEYGSETNGSPGYQRADVGGAQAADYAHDMHNNDMDMGGAQAYNAQEQQQQQEQHYGY